MVKLILGIFCCFLLLVPNSPVFSKDLSSKDIDRLTSKVANKFSRTYCNTLNFGISDKGAMEFALGETNKEFSKKNIMQYTDLKTISEKIVITVEDECQVYDFPVDQLSNLKLN